MKTTLLTKYLITGVLGFGFISALLYARVQITSNAKPTPSLIPLPVASPTSTPVVKGIATTKPQVVNNDPITDCVSSAQQCNGESIRLKQSQCKNIICCGFADGRWEVYASREKCEQAQKGSQPTTQTQQQTNTTNNKVPVFLTYGKFTTYCPSQNVDAVKSIDATMTSKSTQWAKDYNTCADNFYKSDSCHVGCSNTNKSELDTCYALYGYTGDSSSACTKIAWDNYSSCISKCPSASASCDYVYWEQKSLSSQISNLCK